MDVLAFRFFNVFGPLEPAGHAYAGVVPAFVSAALEGRPVHGAGDQTRDFTYVGSVVSVLTDAVAWQVTAFWPVNLAFGSRTSLLSLIAVLEECSADPSNVSTATLGAGDVRDSQADSAQLCLFLDLGPVPLVDAIRATVAWFGSRHS